MNWYSILGQCVMERPHRREYLSEELCVMEPRSWLKLNDTLCVIVWCHVMSMTRLELCDITYSLCISDNDNTMWSKSMSNDNKYCLIHCTPG